VFGRQDLVIKFYCVTSNQSRSSCWGIQRVVVSSFLLRILQCDPHPCAISITLRQHTNLSSSGVPWRIIPYKIHHRLLKTVYVDWLWTSRLERKIDISIKLSINSGVPFRRNILCATLFINVKSKASRARLVRFNIVTVNYRLIIYKTRIKERERRRENGMKGNRTEQLRSFHWSPAVTIRRLPPDSTITNGEFPHLLSNCKLFEKVFSRICVPLLNYRNSCVASAFANCNFLHVYSLSHSQFVSVSRFFSVPFTDFFLLRVPSIPWESIILLTVKLAECFWQREEGVLHRYISQTSPVLWLYAWRFCIPTWFFYMVNYCVLWMSRSVDLEVSILCPNDNYNH
jgi:hypothetical protein